MSRENWMWYSFQYCIQHNIFLCRIIIVLEITVRFTASLLLQLEHTKKFKFENILHQSPDLLYLLHAISVLLGKITLRSQIYSVFFLPSFSTIVGKSKYH